jgi:hypothetical protein
VFRIEYYKQFAWYLYVDYEDEELGCGKQKQFSAGGAGALPIYWDKVRPGTSHVDPDPDPDPDLVGSVHPDPRQSKVNPKKKTLEEMPFGKKLDVVFLNVLLKF